MVITKINQENLTPILRFVDQAAAKAVYFDWDDTLATNPHRPATEKANPVLFNKTSWLFVRPDRLAA